MDNCYFPSCPEDPNSFQPIPWPPSPTCFQFHGVAEDRAASASKSHSQAEKRRRDRINTQLSTLRKLIPNSDKMDKAALLGSVIDQVKDLKRKAVEVSKAIALIPTEVDEVTIDCYMSQDSSMMNKKNKVMIKASVCCDDRPELFRELKQVVQTLRLSTVRADIVSVGGRTKSMLVFCAKDRGNGEDVSSLKQTLKLFLNKIASTRSSMASSCSIRSKRQRFFLQ